MRLVSDPEDPHRLFCVDLNDPIPLIAPAGHCMLMIQEPVIGHERIGIFMKIHSYIRNWHPLFAAICLLGLGACSGDGPAAGAKNVCGNGVIETGELCDGETFPSGSASCEDMGFAGGELVCNASCTVVDTTGCLADSSDPSDATDPADASDPPVTSDPTDEQCFRMRQRVMEAGTR